MGDEAQTHPEAQLVITELETLKLLSDPLRIRIVELLRQRPATVKQLGAALEMMPRSLYYHVNLLERHKLIRVVDTRTVSGIVEKLYRASAYLFVFKDVVERKVAGAGEQGLDVMVSSLAAITNEEIRDSMRSGRIDLAGEAPERALKIAWRLFQLTPDEAGTLASRLEALLDEYEPATGAARPESSQTYRFHSVLFPTYPRSEREQNDAPAES